MLDLEDLYHQPFLRVLDALNTHDESYELAIASGVSTALVCVDIQNLGDTNSFDATGSAWLQQCYR